MTILEKASQLKYDAAPVKRLGVPAYNYWNEALHGVARAGVATMFPQAIAMAAVFDDEEMKDVMHVDEVTITVDLHAGHEKGTAWGCDLSYDYVKINALYHT